MKKEIAKKIILVAAVPVAYDLLPLILILKQSRTRQRQELHSKWKEMFEKSNLYN